MCFLHKSCKGVGSFLTERRHTWQLHPKTHLAIPPKAFLSLAEKGGPTFKSVNCISNFLTIARTVETPTKLPNFIELTAQGIFKRLGVS